MNTSAPAIQVHAEADERAKAGIGPAANLDKARKARAAQRAKFLWAKVKDLRREHRCSCDLRSGMSERDLIELMAREETCTHRKGYLCPVALYYRERVS